MNIIQEREESCEKGILVHNIEYSKVIIARKVSNKCARAGLIGDHTHLQQRACFGDSTTVLSRIQASNFLR